MSGTDPNGKLFGKKGENTAPFNPDGIPPGQELPKNLPKIPGITLHYEIARGGMGVVYSGRQDFLDRRVAVKFLSVELGGDAFAQRFQREAKILAGISHPNIVGCHMADTTPEGQSYLVMEFCDGPNLKAWVADNGPVEPMAAIRLIRSSAMALAHAHQSDIIHRDIKPENILLESVTSTTLDIRFPFSPKIVDLGLARMTHEQVGAGLTSPGSVMGTPSTMSPEQFDDPDSVDFRSDIYGLGCCLYEMLVGQPAFRGTKLTDIVLRKRDASSPNPCDENPNLPAAVGAFTQRLLASDREDRPASYKELDKEANELMTALLANRSKAPPAPTPMPEVQDILDQTVPSQGATPPGGAPSADPFAGGMDATMPQSTPPAGGPAAGKQPPQKPESNTAPGMLNTGEFDFLSEGGPAGGELAAAPAFQESGGTKTPTAATNPMGASPGGEGSKKGLFIGIGAAAVVAVVLALVFGGGKTDDPDPNKKDGPAVAGLSDNASTVANSAPTIASIKMMVDGAELPDSPVNIGASFELIAAASDAEGGELDYKWSWPPRLINPLSQTDAAKITFKLTDGLPGVEHTVDLEVSDASGAKAQQSFLVKVGECPERMPLMGFKVKPEWKIDKRDRSWTEVPDPIDLHWRGRSLKVERTLSTSLGDEDYWEWYGNLLSDENQNGSYARVGLRFDFGDKAYAIQVMREEEGQLWSIELLEAIRDGEAWSYRSLPDICRARWRHLDQVDCRGWFSIQRRRGELIVQIAEAVQPQRNAVLPPLEMKEGLAHTIKLPASASNVDLTLYVDKGIGRFRVRSR